MAAAAIATPSAPPTIERNRLSVSNCRAIRARPAPRAERNAISRVRDVARANRRFATLADAISSKKPTAPRSNFRRGPTSPIVCDAKGIRLLRKPLRWASPLATAFIASWACEKLTPSRSRASA